MGIFPLVVFNDDAYARSRYTRMKLGCYTITSTAAAADGTTFSAITTTVQDEIIFSLR